MKEYLLESQDWQAGFQANDDDDDDDDVTKIAKKVSIELGEEISEYIDSGSFGYAYILKSNKVLKITQDKNEINLIYNLSKSSNIPKYLMTYYNIGKIKGTNYFYILMDYVETLTFIERSVINLFYKNKIQYQNDYYNNIINPKIKSYIKNWAKRSYNSEENYKICISLLPHVIEIVKDLKRHNIKSTDFHGANLGWDRTSNRLIMFDLGGLIENDNDLPKDKLSKLKELIITESLKQNSKIDKWITKIADELGEEIIEYKGAGSFGYAYETVSGKIIKLTADSAEIRLAHKLSKNRNWSKYIINYYNVGRTDKKITDYNGVKRDLYYLLMDEVIPIDNTDIGSIIDNIYMPEIQYNLNYYNNIMNFEDIKYKINMMFGKHGLVRNENYAKIAIIIYPHIVNIVKELKKHGIKETDFHSGNIGWSDDEHSRLVIYDLGGDVDDGTVVNKNKLKRINLTESFIVKFSDYKK
jgi:hypothetical protein